MIGKTVAAKNILGTTIRIVVSTAYNVNVKLSIVHLLAKIRVFWVNLIG